MLSVLKSEVQAVVLNGHGGVPFSPLTGAEGPSVVCRLSSLFFFLVLSADSLCSCCSMFKR